MDWEEIQRLIAQKRYFLLHAPRQTGKTSVLLEMMEALNAQERYHALYVNIEAAQTVRNDADKGMRIVCEAIAASARVYKVEPRLRAVVRALLAEDQPQGVLTQFLAQWSELSEKPIVLFLDEVDALVGDTLISLLRQIRAGYAQRPQAFPQSLVLCGLRGTFRTIASTAAMARSSPEAVRSTSKRNRYGLGTSAQPKSGGCSSSTVQQRGRASMRRFSRNSGRTPAVNRGW